MPNIIFIVYDQAEVLDFSGPFDVFSMAMIATDKSPYEMRIVSPDGATITAIHGFKVVADSALNQLTPGPSDIVFFPGGTIDVIEAIGSGTGGSRLPPGLTSRSHLTDAQRSKLEGDCKAIVDWIEGPGQSAGILATICIGAFFGAKAGIFAGQKATTHYNFLSTLKEWIGDETDIIEGARYVINSAEEGQPESSPLIMSSAGVSAGMDLAFEILGLVMGPDTQALTAELMEYNRTVNYATNLPIIPPALEYSAQSTK